MTVFESTIAVAGQIDVLGALGLCLGFASGAMTGRERILYVSAACATCFGLDYLRLGASTGAAMCALSVLQGLASARFGGAARRPAWFGPFFATSAMAVLVLTVATWSGWPSAFAGIGALCAIRARFQADAMAMRWNFVGASLAWAGHNILVASPFALACDLVTLAGLFLALRRGERRRTAIA